MVNDIYLALSHLAMVLAIFIYGLTFYQCLRGNLNGIIEMTADKRLRDYGESAQRKTFMDVVLGSAIWALFLLPHPNVLVWVLLFNAGLYIMIGLEIHDSQR